MKNKFFKILPYFITLVSVLMLELTVFNLPFYISRNSEYPERYVSASELLVGGAENQNETVILKDNVGSFIEIRDINIATRYITLVTNDADETATIEVRISDDACSNGYRNIGTHTFYGKNSSSKVLSVKSHGPLVNFNIIFTSESKELVLKGLRFNERLPFAFNVWRVALLVLGICIAIYAVKNRLFKKRFDYESEGQKQIFIYALVFCMLFAGAVGILTSGAPISYPNNDIVNQPPYVQQFDAFMKGQLNLDVEPTEALLNAENPYDVSQRGSTFMWDRAYYKGEFFSYYGIAPVILFYFPYYFITKSLPSDGMAALFFTEIFIVAFFFLSREAVKKFAPKTNFAVFLCGVVAAVFSSFVFVAQSCADMYYIPVVGAFAFSALFGLAMFKGYDSEKKLNRMLWLLLAAFSSVGMLTSKPSYVILCFVAVPALVKMVLSKKDKIKDKLFVFAPAAFLIAIGVAAVCYYNYLRFDSLFEFGTSYQLTVVNANYNNLSVEGFFRAIYYYLFQAPSVKAVFPYLVPSHYSVGYFPNYVYQYINVGLFTVPMCLMLFMVPSSFRKNDSAVKKSTIGVLMLSVLSLAFLNYFMAGVHIRYTMDLLLPATFLALIIGAVISQDKNEGRFVGASRYIFALFALSCVFGFIYIFSNERNTIETATTGFYYNLIEMISFIK